MTSTTTTDETQTVFRKLKEKCVPLLGNSLLTPATSSLVSRQLSDLIQCLSEAQTSGFKLTTSLISYVFFPLATILRRNASSDIPNQVLEKIFVVLGILCETWWWDCDFAVWDQVFMLCGAVIGGIEGKGKAKYRDDETKEAASQCLLSILRIRSPDKEPDKTAAHLRLEKFKEHAGETKFIPVLGQTINSLLETAHSHHLPLQKSSLELLNLLASTYVPSYFSTSVLPGIVSEMCKVALGVSDNKGWAKGDVCAGALMVIKGAIIRAIGDKICADEGAVRDIENIEDLADLASDRGVHPTTPTDTIPYATPRTQSWLQGTSSQVHIALNSLAPITSHPTSSALIGFCDFAFGILANTVLTLPQSQPLLLSYLLSASNSDFSIVSSLAQKRVHQLLEPNSKSHATILFTLVHITKENLASLPRLLPTLSDSKVEHAAGLIEAVCRLTVGDNQTRDSSSDLQPISEGIGKLFGPSGGIEKWGWGLLSVLEFEEPSLVPGRDASALLMLEASPEMLSSVSFPEANLKNVASQTTHQALIRMLRSLGSAGGLGCLFAVEWFINAGRNGQSSRATAALWCACHLLEGVSGLSLSSNSESDKLAFRANKRLNNLARWLARTVSEIWDRVDDAESLQDPVIDSVEDEPLAFEHVRGLKQIRATLEIVRPRASTKDSQRTDEQEPLLRKAFALQLLSVSAGILQARFNPLLLYTLYPILHSLTSPSLFLSSTAFATLQFVTINTSYASPGNLLLSNFDYALDSISRRMTRRWLDVHATKVLVIMVRLVGGDVVEKAGDIVEECFDRLDDFHGYTVLTEGLIEVLSEVLKVVESDNEAIAKPETRRNGANGPDRDGARFEALLGWLESRNMPETEEENDDYGPAPREAWGKPKGVDDDDSEHAKQADTLDSPPPTPIQALTKQIIARSMYLLTHESPVIRSRILNLLSSAATVLPESALLPSIHLAWPFVLNRLRDSHAFVVSAAAALVESLAIHVGEFMTRRIWDDVWPRFRALLKSLDAADSTNALARRGKTRVGTESAYSHSHRLYRSMLRTMSAAVKGVQVLDGPIWELILLFRRFLHCEAHEELQKYARQLYVAAGLNNGDAVWLALNSTAGRLNESMMFLVEHRWDIAANVDVILTQIKSTTS